MAFDIEGARAAGYSDGEIADFLGKDSGFDVAGARKAGYEPAEIVSHLVSLKKPAGLINTPARATDAEIDSTLNTPINSDVVNEVGAQPSTVLEQPLRNEDRPAAVGKGRDAMLNPEFIQNFRQELGSLPVEKRLAALKAYADTDKSVYGRAARVILAEEEAKNQQVTVEGKREGMRLLPPGTPPTPKPGKGKAREAAFPDATPNFVERFDGITDKQVAGANEIARGAAGVREAIKTDAKVATAKVQSKADEGRSAGQWASDTWNAVNQGTISLAQLPLNIVAPSSLLADSLRETQKELSAKESDVLQSKHKLMADRIKNESGFLDQYLTTIYSLVSDPALAVQEGVKQLPNFIGVLGAAKLTAAGAGGLINVGGRLAPATVGLGEAISGGAIKAAAQSAGATAGGIGASMVMAGGDAAGNTYERLTDPKQTPLSTWEKNPDYQKLIAVGTSSQDAIVEIATAKARMAALITAPLGVFGFMGAESAIVSSAIRRAGKPQGAANIIGKELAGEQLEEGLTQAGGNLATSTIDPNQSLMEGVPQAMGTAAVVSGPFAGMAVATEKLSGNRDEFAAGTLNPNLAGQPKSDPIAEIAKAQTVDEAISAAQAAVQSSAAVDNIAEILKANQPAGLINSPPPNFGLPTREQLAADQLANPEIYGPSLQTPVGLSPDIAALTTDIQELETANANPEIASPAATAEAAALDEIPAGAAAGNEVQPAGGGAVLDAVRAEPGTGALSTTNVQNQTQAGAPAQGQAAPAEAPKAGARAGVQPAAAGTPAGDTAVQAAGVAPAQEIAASLNAAKAPKPTPANPAITGAATPAKAPDSPTSAQQSQLADESANNLDAAATPQPTARQIAIQAEKAKIEAGKAAPKPIDPRLVPKSLRDSNPEHIGKDNTPLVEGGKPFKTNREAKLAKKKQPMMRVVKAGKGKTAGYVLAPKTEKQIAAQKKAARRLGGGYTSPAGEAISAHSFIADKGGLAPEARADMGMDGNQRIGSRWLFAGAGKGLTIERATEYLVEEGYLPEGASHSQALALIKRSLTQPQYTPEGTERMALAEAEANFADHLAAQEEAAQNEDPFDSLAEDGFDPFDIETTGYDELSDPIKLEVNALLALAESKGIDTDSIKEQAYEDTRNGSEQDYYEAAKSALTQAVAESDGGGRQDSGAQGDAGSQGGLTAPTQQEVLDQQDRKDSADSLDQRQQIDREATGQTLTSQTAPEQRSDTSGDMFAREKADAEIAKRNAGRAANDDPNQGAMFSRAERATDILDAAAITGKDRLEALRDVRAGLITPDELEAAYPAKVDQTETPAFKKWFGDSKVVDAAGKPLVVYHGTGVNVGNRGEFMSGDFDTFDGTVSGKSSKTGAPANSFFFTDDAQVASSYTVAWRGEWSETRKENANVMPVYLALKKPLKVSAKGENWREIQYKGEFRDVNEIVQMAQEAGKYDGVIITKVKDHGVGKTEGQVSTTYVAFEPTQIKSAIGNNGNFDPADQRIQFSRAAKPVGDQTQTPEFKRWSNDAPLVSSADAMTYPFKTGEKVVLEAYHGTARPDRVGTVFNKKRATSGPMAYFTSEPELASGYAKGKADTSLNNEDQAYETWFKFKPQGQRSATDIVRAWYGLSAEQKDTVARLAPRVMFGEEQEADGGNTIVLGPEDHDSGTGSYDYNLAQTRTSWDRRGNPLKALVEDWLNSGNLFNDELRFLQVLKLAGFPVKDVTYDSPQDTFPFVYKTYVAMQSPLVASDLPASLMTALDEAAKKDRSRAQQMGADMWDKNTRTVKEWIANLKDPANGTASYVWTSIPDKVTAVFKAQGYDGIIDWSGKGGGHRHPVYIPFEETQVKSAIGNNGKFDPLKKNILFSRAPLEPVQTNSGATAFKTAEIALANPKLNVRQPGGDVKRIDFEIRDRAVYARAIKDGDTVAQAKEEATVGIITLDIDPDGVFKSLRNIEVFQSKRGSGIAEKVVGGIVESLPAGAALNIHDILPTATGFWDKMGAKFPRSEDTVVTANLTPEQFRSAYDSRTRTAGAEGQRQESRTAEYAGAGSGRSGADGAPAPRAAVRNPSTVERVQAAVAELIGGKQLPNKLGRVVATTASEIKSYWEPQIGQNVQLGSEGEAGQAQAFFDPRTKTVFLIADNILAGDETAVAAHELMHKHGQTVLGADGWDKLHDTINGWSNSPEDSDERAVYNYARSRVEAVGMELSSQEMFPYAVEAAIKMGVKPSLIAKKGTVARWLGSVKYAMQQAWGKVTGKPETFKTQDLVDLAFGIAQMENPESAAEMVDALAPRVWRSALADGIQGINAKAQPGEGWRAQITGLVSKGIVKADEVEWTGLTDWLKLQTGKVTKDQVLDYLDGNGVKVEETMLGDLNTRLPDGWKVQENSDEDGTWEVLDAQGVMVGSGDTRAEAIESAQDEDERTSTDTKYGNYQLPGGQNYRELLLTLPVKETADGIPEGYTIIDVAAEDRADGMPVPEDEVGPWRYKGPGVSSRIYKTREEAVAAVKREATMDATPAGRYTSSHWDGRANILAHIRFNERTDADGKRVLFIEEIQSDWAQEGKKKGFASDGAVLLEAQKKEYETLVMRMVNGPRDLSEQDRARIQELRPIISGLGRPTGVVPNAPFVGKTDAWVALAIKRMVSYAAENGFDRVAFVNGTQSAERYSLSQQVESIEWGSSGSRFPNGRTLGVVLKGKAHEIPVTVDANGKVVDGTREWYGKPLDEVIGKAVAEKIMATETGELRGLGLNIGGEGMKAFYDKIVPTVAKDVLKKLGGGALTRMGVQTDESSEPWRVVNDLGTVLATMKTEALANGWLKQNGNLAWAKNGRVEKMGADQPQLGFDITPAMREKASAGLPMFSRSPIPTSAQQPMPQARQPAFDDTLETDGWSMPEPTRADKVIYNLQDGRIDLKRVQEAIKAAGAEIAEKFDARQAETLYPGRVARRAETFLNIEVKPLLQDMALNKIDMAELGDYLIARHAPERNAQVAKVNPDMPDGGAGRNSQGVLMTDDAAAEYLAAIPAAKLAKLTTLARKVDAITAGTRALLVGEGLEKQETVDAWTKAYKNYVPLFKDEAEHAHPQGRGFTVKGSASKRSTGSTKEVTNVLAHVLMQRESAITRAEKNRVGLSLYGLALSNPNTDFWTTIKPNMSTEQIMAELQAMGVDPLLAGVGMQSVPTIRTVDPLTDKVVDRPNPMYKNLPGAITLRVNGEDRVLMLNQDNERALRMATNLKNLDGVTQLDLASSIVGKSTRWIASVNTQYNPAFGLINVTRDTLGGIVNLTNTPLRKQKIKVLANVPAALKGIARDLRGDTRTEWSDLFNQFQDDGGQTGFKEMFRTADDRAKAIEKEIAAAGKSGLAPGKMAHAVLDLLDDFNTSLENAVRLSAYKAALDQGMSRPASAKLARELTVDFNRKGRAGREIGPLYAFFNASVQGTARTLETLAGPAGAKIIAGGLALGGLQALMLAFAGFEDDEPPEFIKSRALIIPIGGEKRYIAIPYPLGLHVIPNTGRVLTELTINGGKDIGKRTVEAVGEIAGAFNPMGGGNIFTTDGALRTLAPTIVDPLIELAANKNFAGFEIEKKPFREESDNRPGFQRARESTQRSTTGQVYLGISKGINFATGGNDFEAGAASPTPERIRYLAQTVGGGVLRELEKSVNASMGLLNDDDVTARGIPVVGRFYGQIDTDQSERSRYFESAKTIKKYETSRKAADKAGATDIADKLIQRHPELEMARTLNNVQERISKLNKKAAETINDREELKRIDEDRFAEMKRLNDEVRAMEKARRKPTIAERLRGER